MPPLIRLTDLGIRLVDREVLEASRAFGANPRQQLFGVQLPLALPNIMAGINQTTMMALSMVVIASMIARGLGYEVLLGINRLEVGRGLLAGLGIVVLAVLFDRITQSMDSACARRPAMSKIEVKSIYKVFGPHPAKWLQAAQGGMSKELLAKSGHTLGLRDISLSIDEGSIYVIMGLSGSGKSTLIRHFNRLIEPSAGQILVDGVDVVSLNKRDLETFRQKKMSMVFQRFGLFPHRTVLENAAYGLAVQGVGRAERERRARDWLEQVGLSGFEQQYPHQLSGGMQQRVGLARALATDAEILLMDEGLFRAGSADPPRDAGPAAAIAGQAEQDHRVHHA